MTTPRRALALLATATLVTGSMLLLGASAANALPNGFTVQVGAPVNISATATSVTFTQTTPVAVVDATTLDVGIGETFTVVQPDPDMLMVVRNTTASPVQWNGTVTADANLLVISTAGINVNGSATAGGDLVLSTGDTSNANASLAFIPLAPTAASGAVSIGSAGVLTAGLNLAIAGNDILVSGTMQATGGIISITSNDDIEYPRQAGSGLFADGAGFASGLIQTSSTSVISAAVILIEASAPSAALLDGTFAGDGLGGIIGESAPGAVAVIGQAGSNSGSFDAFANGAGPAGGTLGAHLFGGATTPFFSDEAFQLITYGALVPEVSIALVPELALLDDLEVGFINSCSIHEDSEEPTSTVVPTYAELIFFGADWEGANLLPAGFDPTIPNQAPIVVPGLGTVAINQQSTTTVDGYQVLTSTAVHVVTDEGEFALGVVECAQPAPQLAATGAAQAQTTPVLVGAALVMLAGILLVARRRRVAA